MNKDVDTVAPPSAVIFSEIGSKSIESLAVKFEGLKPGDIDVPF